MRKRSERWWWRAHPLAWEIDRRVPVEWVVKRATVSSRYHYCYCRIPKCANSTVMKTLAHYDGSLVGAEDVDDVGAIKRETGWLFGARALSPKTFAKKYACFTFVRNPFTRTLSAYLDKIASAEEGQYLPVAEAVGKSRARDVEFSEFIRFLSEGGLFWNAHWAPQVALLPVNRKRLRFVGKVERLDTDLALLMEHLGLGVEFGGTVSRQDRRTGSVDRAPEFYTKRLIEEVAELYAADFKAFEYPQQLLLEGGHGPSRHTATGDGQ